MKSIITRITRADRKAYRIYAHKIQQGRCLGLRKFCLWIGLPVPMLVMFLGIACIASLSIGYRSFLIEALAYLFSSTVNLIIKGINKRKRPPENTYRSAIPFDQYSFPSGHAAGTMSIAVCLGILAVPNLLVPLIAWAIMVGIARFFDGSHHPSDIIGGFTVGIFAALGLLAILILW